MSDPFGLFPFIGPAHPFRDQVREFEAAIRIHPRCLEHVLGRRAAPAVVHAEIKAVPVDGGGYRLDRFYWSLQTWDSSERRGFRASTLSYAAKDGQARWYEFPEDSYLVHMERWFAGRAAAAEGAVQVLRYVPLRRFTFRMRDADGREVIGKFKRRSRYLQAWDLLGRVERAVSAAGAPFLVSSPLRLDEEHALYTQSVLRGEDLADRLNRSNFLDLMPRVGALHCTLHRIQIDGLPRVEPAAWLDEARRNVRWIGWFEPGRADALERAVDGLAGWVAEEPAGVPVFCHGDFVCSQILASNDRWAVTDFDLCHLGDPYRDMAILLASLTYDVPLFQSAASSGSTEGSALIEAATEAYLAGYERLLGEPIDRERLAWHRACAEIYYLALMLKKDRFRRAAFERGAGLALSLAGIASGAASAG